MVKKGKESRDVKKARVDVKAARKTAKKEQKSTKKELAKSDDVNVDIVLENYQLEVRNALSRDKICNSS